jgi:hypothetical protein
MGVFIAFQKAAGCSTGRAPSVANTSAALLLAQVEDAQIRANSQRCGLSVSG